MTHFWVRIITFASFFCLYSRVLAQNSGISTREELQEHYKDSVRGENKRILRSAPAHHIIPNLNEVTVGVEGGSPNLIIGRSGSDVGAHQPEEIGQRLQMSGWSASPFAAFSIRSFGLGFSAEAGRRDVYFLQEQFTEKDSLGQKETYLWEEHYSKITYSGVGFFLFANPRFRLPSYIKPTMIFGVKRYVVLHEAGEIRESQFDEPTFEKYRYGVQRFHGGANIGIYVLRSFIIRPWLDYSTVNVDIAKKTADESDQVDDDSSTPLSLDRDLLWNSTPRAQYGLDFAVSLGGFQVQLGGLFGLIGSINQGDERMADRSYSINVSYSHRGR